MECTLSGSYDDDDFRTLRQKIFTARKEHKCGECGRAILKGEQYEGYNGVSDGSFYWSKTCLDCLSIRDAFYPFGGFMFGNVLDSVDDHIIYELGGDVSEKCIVPLTDKAKKRVFETIEIAWEE